MSKDSQRPDRIVGDYDIARAYLFGSQRLLDPEEDYDEADLPTEVERMLKEDVAQVYARADTHHDLEQLECDKCGARRVESIIRDRFPRVKVRPVVHGDELYRIAFCQHKAVIWSEDFGPRFMGVDGMPWNLDDEVSLQKCEKTRLEVENVLISRIAARMRKVSVKGEHDYERTMCRKCASELNEELYDIEEPDDLGDDPEEINLEEAIERLEEYGEHISVEDDQ